MRLGQVNLYSNYQSSSILTLSQRESQSTDHKGLFQRKRLRKSKTTKERPDIAKSKNSEQRIKDSSKAMEHILNRRQQLERDKSIVATLQPEMEMAFQ